MENDERMRTKEGFGLPAYMLMLSLLLATLLLCVCLGSVNVPLGDTAEAFRRALLGLPQDADSLAGSIILPVRLPRVLAAALVGALLSVSGAAMQGLLKNPLADGSTLGVSSGASLGAVAAMAFGFHLPGLPMAGTAFFSMAFAFASLLLILSLTYRFDASLSTNTIILIGVIFSMFASSLSSLLITFAGERVKTITFWTMGSLQGVGYRGVGLLFACLLLCGGVLYGRSRELNAFAVGEDNARSIGVHVRAVKLTVLICASAMIGVCVSLSGTIGFVGLVTPHMLRMRTGPNHKRLLPAAAFGGAVFLMLCDLAARLLLSPRELPIGVVSSLIGAVVFVYIFYTSRKGRCQRHA